MAVVGERLREHGDQEAPSGRLKDPARRREDEGGDPRRDPRPLALTAAEVGLDCIPEPPGEIERLRAMPCVRLTMRTSRPQAGEDRLLGIAEAATCFGTSKHWLSLSQ